MVFFVVFLIFLAHFQTKLPFFETENLILQHHKQYSSIYVCYKMVAMLLRIWPIVIYCILYSAGRRIYFHIADTRSLAFY